MENINNMINTETTIFSLYEASILGDIETAINKDDITEALWKGLCEWKDQEQFQSTCKFLQNMLKDNAKMCNDLYKKPGKAGINLFPKDTSKNYIHIVSLPGKDRCLNIEIVVPGLKLYIDSVGSFAKEFNANMYSGRENSFYFYYVHKDSPVYELPNELKPFVNKCIECVNKHTRKKFNLI